MRTRQERPRQWAATQYNLGTAYFERIKGDRAENLEDAITVLQQAADVYKSEGMHSKWADVMNQLGIVYTERIKGDRAENLEHKIEAHKESLRYRSRDGTPDEWATAMHNLAIAYYQRVRGNRVENVEKSIQYALAALSKTSPQNKPTEWAQTMATVGLAYLQRKLGDPAENIERALDALNQAIGKIPRQMEPIHWAKSMNNLANAYMNRGRGERAANLRQAITACRQALEVMTREARPVDWAALMHNLGGAYMRLADEMQAPEEDAVYLEQAIRALEDALTIRTMEAMPREHRETQYRLGNLYFANQRWAEAYMAYDAALQAGEVAYRASATREARKSELQRAGFMPIRAAYCLAKTKRLAEAVERLEQGLARSLAESLALDEAALQHVTQEDRTALTAARARLHKLDGEARAVSEQGARSFLDISVEMRMVRQELEAIVERIRAYVPRFMPAQLFFDGIADIAEELGQPLVYLLATLHGSLALIVPPGVKTLDAEHAIWLDGLRTDHLKNMLSDRDATAWGYLHCVAGDGTEREIEILKRILDEALPILEANVMVPVVQYLTAHGYRQAILIPTDPFGLLPLPALADEMLALSVAPSADALQGAQCAARERASRDSTLLAVGNPLPNPKPLPYARIEVEEIGRLFDPGARRPPLFETDASLKNMREALPGTTHLHLSCHGSFNVAMPLESALYLSGDDRLTLRQLLDGGLDLSAVKLVVLSACQTALTDFQTVPDEAIGFPAGFFETSVPGVIGTLWPVDDRATAIFMFKFYESMILDRQSPARALRQAQIWLRDATGHKLALMAHQMLDRSTREAEPPGFRKWAERQMQPERRDAKPYNHPVYWSAFYHVGV